MDIKINSINIHYEVYGEGTPIILLHGNSENHKIFNKLIDKLKDKYKVYALDSRCHGKSENTKEISYDLMSADIIEFIKKLKINKPILYGFSDGGITGLMVAIKEPSILSKLIVSGANINPRGLKTGFIILTRIGYTITRNKIFKMILEEPNIKPEELKRIKIPVILLVGSKDIVKNEHTIFIKDNIENSKLEIITKATHGSYIVNNDKIYYIIKKYI